MPAIFKDFGVEFLYPENWSIVEQTDDDPQTVALETPSGAQWTLHVYQGAVDLHGLLDEAVEALAAEYPDFEKEVVDEPDDGADVGFDMHFFYLDLLIEARVRGLLLPGKALVWISQAESRDFEKLEMVFKAVITSLLNKTRGE